MAKKKTTEKALNIDNILFNCRDYLRAARNSGSFFEKRGYIVEEEQKRKANMLSLTNFWMAKKLSK